MTGAERGYITGSEASGITTTPSSGSPSRSTASRASALVGTITRPARWTASWRRRMRAPPRRCSLRLFRAARSCTVTTIGHGQWSIAPSIHGE